MDWAPNREAMNPKHRTYFAICNGTLPARVSSTNEIAGDWPAGSGNARGAALVAGTPAILQSLPPAYASVPWAADSWSMGTRLALVWIIETHRFQFGENCAHENLGLDAKDEPLGVV